MMQSKIWVKSSLKRPVLRSRQPLRWKLPGITNLPGLEIQMKIGCCSSMWIDCLMPVLQRCKRSSDHARANQREPCHAVGRHRHVAVGRTARRHQRVQDFVDQFRVIVVILAIAGVSQMQQFPLPVRLRQLESSSGCYWRWLDRPEPFG